MKPHARDIASAVLAGISLLALALMGTHVHAQTVQTHNPAHELLRYGELAYAEAVRVPGGADGKTKVEVLLRVSYDFLVFTKTEIFSPDSTFSAGLDVSIDVKQRAGGYIATENNRTEIFAGEFDAANTRNKFLLLKKSFILDPGNYVVSVELNDAKSTRSKSFKLSVDASRLFSHDSLVVGSIIPLAHNGDEISVLGFGGRLLFTRPSVFAVTASSVEGAEWELRLDRVTGERQTPVLSSTIVPTAILRGYALNKADGIVPSFRLEPEADGDGIWVVFKPALDTLSVGKYSFTLVVKNGAGEDSIRQQIGVFWQEMPISLYDPVFATELMRYILTEDEFDEMTSGDDHEKQQKLEDWWKTQDPTPATPYNERMYEYFRRVDEAYFRFQTTKHTNGALTDRGKIFILFGEPESIGRDLKSGEPPQEVWKYPSLGKTFVFTDQERNGSYRLAN